MAKPVFLGKLVLHWCGSCNVPVLGEKCACGATTKFVNVTPPGDIRPAFPYDIARINDVSIRQFGKKLIADDEFVVYNKAPYEDRMEEIICGGTVIGTIRFEIEKRQWVLLLRLEGARRIFNPKIKTIAEDIENNVLKSWIMINEGAVPFIAEGTSVLVPGILKTAPDIKPEDEVVVITPNFEVVAAGRAKMSSEEMKNSGRGKAVKNRWSGLPVESEPPLDFGKDEKESEKQEKSMAESWNKVVAANTEILNQVETDSILFIRNAAANVNKKITCSYSGGKDSLVTLHMTQKASEGTFDYDILFSDTGLEFEETIQNVAEIVQIYQKPFKEISAGNIFWDGFEINGPPHVDNRWCTQSCKLTPITTLIESNYLESGGCLTFIGQRQYESLARARSQRIWKSPSVRGQVGAAPIQEWTALHVWLYIFKHNLHYNPLYEKGLDRIGCWLCPAASLADFENLRNTHPDAMKMWDEKLLTYAMAEKIPNAENWVRYGLWRFEKYTPAMEKLAKEKGVIESNAEKQP
ncbi:phosphoadenosine phosphosulfate reductase family protein [Methanolapillus millepedarum]|uniref:Phosphoadenosine phosphosulfate reductase n=1 Tax=Methanolapillus millepedarum TaxID=3028296 RepID=A0AA96V4S9_9EURY|nr:Phosphoadenosine phosphosulfate reductase [Methanosarcinaceae archaeon Ac7]